MIFAAEKTVLEAIYSLVGSLGFLDGLMAFCAHFLVFIVVVVFLAELLVHREPYERLAKIFYSVLALIFSAGALQGILAFIVTRETPGTVLGISTLEQGAGVFPAFATTWAVAFAVIAWVTVSKRLGVWLSALAIIIGFAQLYVGMHWPLDVATSMVIGVIGPLLAKRFIAPSRS